MRRETTINESTTESQAERGLEHQTYRNVNEEKCIRYEYLGE